MEKKHGGARRNAGRKSEVQGETMLPVTFSLDPLTLRKLRVVGGANMSKWLREVVAAQFEVYQKSDPH